MPAPPAPPDLARLVLLAIAAEGLLTLMDALIKQLSPRYPTLEIAFLRYAFGMVGAVVYALWMRPGWPTREAAAYNGLRALLIVVTATSFFFALGRLPLADAIAMSFISPALTALLGAMLLGERLDWRIGLALAAGFLGMLLIVGGKLGAAGIGEEVLIGAAAVILALPAFWVWKAPTLADLGQFAFLGTIGVVVHTMLAHAFARIEAARLAPITYVTLVWGVVFGFLFFAEVPGLATIVGAALIVLGTLVTQRR